MKKAILFPVFGIVSLTLLSFRPAPINNKIITCSNGLKIIPSTVQISSSDQAAIVSIVQSYGSSAGYLVYKNSSNVTQTYNAPSSGSGLSELDSEYGSDLANGNSFSGVLAFNNSIGVDQVVLNTVNNSSTTSTIAAQLEVILASYE